MPCDPEYPGQQPLREAGESNGRADMASPSLYSPISGPLIFAFRENAERVNAKVTCADTPDELVHLIAEWISGKGWTEVVCEEEHLLKLFREQNFVLPVSQKLSASTEVAITGCESLIAQLGSVIVSSAQSGSRKIFIYPPVHIVVAFSSQLSETLEEGYSKTLMKYTSQLPSFISVITGPSRTADIEKTLVLGAHGPVELHIFILNDSFSSK